MNTHLTRRRFLATTACVCTGVSVGCAANQSFVRAEVDAQHARIPLAQLRQHTDTIVYIDALAASIAIRHDTDAHARTVPWRALLLVCTHRGCNVAPHRGGYLCPCHDSRFDAEGKVLQGPANEALYELPCTLDGDQLLVDLRAQ